MTEQSLLKQLNAVCPYYTMFPLDFPLDRLRGARARDVVLDPFCGRGSTNFAARLRGLASIGADSNPVAVAIAQAKVVATSPGRIAKACQHILAQESAPRLPEGEFWERSFHPHTLAQLCTLREALLVNTTSPARTALRALILGRLHGPRNKRPPYSYCSNQMPRTYAAKPAYATRFWRRRRMQPPFVDVAELVVRKASYFFGQASDAPNATILHADSRHVDFRDHLPTKRRLRWIITSPPYYGMRTYVPDQWLRYWFLGGPPEVKYQFTGQLDHGGPHTFAKSLAQVWRNVARAALPDARLVIRFGGIRDRQCDPRSILHESMSLADVGWSVMTTRSAGSAAEGRRQADQFLRTRSIPVDEFDLYARLRC